ncbi:MAG: hypothetical protein K6G18_14210 [Treponema sp.]|nr:hypothetical protein [Treponema sp.]MCR5622990.1 hypothetical protein [Treponema sp.]
MANSIQEVLERGYIHIDDGVGYKGITEIYNELAGHAGRLQRAYVRLNDSYFLYVPTFDSFLENGVEKTLYSSSAALLTLLDGGNVKPRSNDADDGKWMNFLSEDLAEITEIDVENEKGLMTGPFKEQTKRVTFMKVGNEPVKFIGVFEAVSAERRSYGCARIYKRISDRIDISELKASK